MTDNEFIESLKIEENIFELKENCKIGYLVHYYAPFTGAGEYEISSGTRFCLQGPMRDDAMYMHPMSEDSSMLINELTEKENNNILQLSSRLAGFSFFITEEQLQKLELKFVLGSKKRSLEIFELIRKRHS